MTTILETDLHASAAELARALSDARGLFVLRSDRAQALRAADATASFVGCEPVEVSDGLVPEMRGEALESETRPPERDAWAGRRAAPRWVGFVPYEHGRALERRPKAGIDRRPEPWIARPRWLRYDAVLRVDHASGKVIVEADDRAAATRLLSRLSKASRAAASFEVGALSWSDDDRAHADKVARVIAYLRAGDAYQVNLSRRASFSLSGDPLAFFEALSSAAPTPYGFFLDSGDRVVVSTTPELALDLDGRALRTGPIKGTRTRGADAPSDRARALELDADPKERAELTMAIDLHRNDLGKVARPGSVRVLGEPRVVFGATVMSRVVEVVAELGASSGARGASGGRTLADAMAAILPCGSVTGAPKSRAMEIIAELESARRGLYTGLVGTVRRDGGATLAMAIRTAVLRPRASRGGEGACAGSAGNRCDWEGEYFAGGGVVLGSDPEREAEETRWKASHLLGLAEPETTVDISSPAVTL